MKQKTQTYNQDFKMPHLFREDLESIEKIIRDALAPREYKLDSKDFEYKEVGEIKEDNDITNQFNIQTRSPYIDIHFNRNSARIFAGDDDLKTIGAIKKITAIISKGERKYLWLLSKLSVYIAPFLFFVPLQVFIEIPKEKIDLTKVWAFILLPIFAVTWWALGYRSDSQTFSIIEFVYRKDRSNFFSRNKDQIILITIGAIFGALATIFFQKIFR